MEPPIWGFLRNWEQLHVDPLLFAACCALQVLSRSVPSQGLLNSQVWMYKWFMSQATPNTSNAIITSLTLSPSHLYFLPATYSFLYRCTSKEWKWNWWGNSIREAGGVRMCGKSAQTGRNAEVSWREQFNPTSRQQGLRIIVLGCSFGLDQQRWLSGQGG